MKSVASLVKQVGVYAAKKSAKSPSLWYFYQEKESKVMKEALKRK